MARDVEPGFDGHAHVEEDHVGRERLDRVARRRAVGAVGDDRDVGVALEHLMHEPARERFVVGDRVRGSFVTGSNSRRGMRDRTTSTPGEALRTESDASVP